MGFCESFLQMSACITCHKTFLPRNFHGIQYVVFTSYINTISNSIGLEGRNDGEPHVTKWQANPP